MKQIINGRRYDTETSEEVAYWESSCSRTDFRWYEETLYRKKTGEFFLVGNGNGLSPYTRSIDSNSWTGTTKIIPLSIEEAKEWIEQNSNEIYEELFGEVAE